MELQFKTGAEVLELIFCITAGGWGLQQLLHLLLPELRHAGGAVAARVLARRDRNRRPFFTRLSSRSMMPVSGGLRSSSAELIARSAAWMRSSPGEGL